MCSPGANGGKPPRECFVIQLEEAKAEWQRHKTVNSQMSQPRLVTDVVHAQSWSHTQVLVCSHPQRRRETNTC
jgi:hypothetical protein